MKLNPFFCGKTQSDLEITFTIIPFTFFIFQDSGSSSPKPAAGPQPVPPPSRVSSKQKLSVSELGKLPPPMSMKDRVHRYRKGPETPPSPSPDDGISGGDSPPTWTEEERRVIFGPEKSKTTVDGDFKIDTTKSFLDSSKPAG